jgi:hypothetical protein
MNANPPTLRGPVRKATGITAVIDLVIGLAFLLGPELSINLWPTPVSVELKRFIGAIILGNGVGALMIIRQPTWEGARVLFMVAWVYGVAVFVFLLFDLVRGVATPFFWVYITVDAAFLAPITIIYLSQERAYRSWRAHAASMLTRNESFDQ